MPINKYERRELKTSVLANNSAVGYDCEGKLLKIEDKVKVIKEESEREYYPEYKFCSTGKEGKIIKNGVGGLENWFVIVGFLQEDGTIKEAMCTDYFLEKLT